MLPPSAVARVAPQLRVASRQMSVISGPPRNKISGAEKIAHGLVITGSILALPAYVLVNIKHYKARE